MGGDWKEMFEATQNGDIELVKYHLKMGVDLNYQHPEYMTSPLIECIRMNKLEMAKLLLENGAKASAKEGFGSATPLSIAKSQKNHQAIHLLMPYLRKENPNNSNFRINTILLIAGRQKLGKAIVKELLENSQKVVIACENKDEWNAIAETLKSETGNPAVSLIHAEWSNIQKCINLIEHIKNHYPDLNILINNAGIKMIERKYNENGLEMSFMMNYLVPYLFNHKLLSLLKKNQPSRIININAGLYALGQLDVSKAPIGLDFYPGRTYADTELWKVMSTIDLAENIEGSGVTINEIHPETIDVGFGKQKNLFKQITKIVNRLRNIQNPIATAPIWLVLSEKMEGVNGKYYDEKELVKYNEVVKNKKYRKLVQVKTQSIIDKVINQ